MSFRVIPITLKQANSFVTANHRHHGSVAGCKFALGLSDGELIGVAGGVIWTGKRSGRDNGVPKELKQRWIYKIK